MQRKKNCKDVINVKKIKENIEKLSTVDKSLIPQYLDNVKQKNKVESQEITKDNPYYKFL